MGPASLRRRSLAVRLASTLLGAWLVLSPFLWRHAGAEGMNAMAAGLLVVFFAPLAVWAPPLRFGSAYAAGWLLVTSPFFRHEIAWTPASDVLVSLAIVALALVPGVERFHYRHQRAQAYA